MIEGENRQELEEEDLCLWLCRLAYNVYLKQRLTLITEIKQNKYDTVDRNVAEVICWLAAVVCVTWGKRSL